MTTCRVGSECFTMQLDDAVLQQQSNNKGWMSSNRRNSDYKVVIKLPFKLEEMAG